MILLGDSAKLLKDFKDECIDLTVTSPPYDDMRNYNGNSSFDFKSIAQELYRVTKQGGVVCWIVGDRTINGDESGTSFKQALYFKEIGFKLHDTMIQANKGLSIPSSKRLKRYHQVFQYMFIFCKDFVKTFNPIEDRKTKHGGLVRQRIIRQGREDKLKHSGKFFTVKEYGMRYNIWDVSVGGFMIKDKDLLIYHGGVMNESIAEDHIKSWSNEGDIVLDPFLGSGTTYKMASLLNRIPIGIEINPEYIEVAKSRIKPHLEQTKLV